MRVFLDANILFSAAKADGPVRALLKLLGDAGHECCADAYVVEEARRNLAAKSPAGLAKLEPILAAVRIGAVQARAVDLPASFTLADKDRPVLAAAIAAGCGALVTGDRTHFGPHYGRTVRGVKILSPAMAAQELLRGRLGD